MSWRAGRHGSAGAAGPLSANPTSHHQFALDSSRLLALRCSDSYSLSSPTSRSSPAERRPIVARGHLLDFCYLLPYAVFVIPLVVLLGAGASEQLAQVERSSCSD